MDGVPVMNASPTDFHQAIATNILFELGLLRGSRQATWIPIMGVGARVPAAPRNLPQPDVMVKGKPLVGKSFSDEALVLFEVLSPSNDPPDQAWRRKVYSSVSNLEHYVTVAQKSVIVTRHDRVDGWKAVRMDAIDGVLELPALGGAIAMRAIYRDTPHAV